jgi:hypothetical protein
MFSKMWRCEASKAAVRGSNTSNSTLNLRQCPCQRVNVMVDEELEAPRKMVGNVTNCGDTGSWNDPQKWW